VVVEVWDGGAQAWKFVKHCLSAGPIHTHRFPAPVRGQRIRLALKAGANPRFAEIVLHGAEVLGTNAPPTILMQPQRSEVPPGAPAVFEVNASGAEPLEYQWLKDGVELQEGPGRLGVRSPTLTLEQVSLADEGSYSVRVSNAVGPAVLSDAAELWVIGAASLLSGFTLAAGAPTFLVQGEPGATYRLEMSEDLETWVFVGRVTAAEASFLFTDTSPDPWQARFYRAVREL